MDKCDKAMTPKFHTAVARHNSATGAPNGSIDRRIRAFLNGESHGEDVLGALYGRIVDEPIPEQLRALLKR